MDTKKPKILAYLEGGTGRKESMKQLSETILACSYFSIGDMVVGLN